MAFIDITEFGTFHHSSGHTQGSDLMGGRTAITTEALLAYNGLRAYLGQSAVDIETIGQWAFDNTLTNNTTAWGDDLKGVGLYYAMQGAKVGWIRDDAFDPQILADIQRTARLGDPADVAAMIGEFGHPGFLEYLEDSGLLVHFIETLKMEPHYGGWMHGRTHGWLEFEDGAGNEIAIAHDLNHLTVLSHDQMTPFMNDTFDWPQWDALNVAEQDVIDYFQSMVVLGDPQGDALPVGTAGAGLFTDGDDVWGGTIAGDVASGLAGHDVLRGWGGDDALNGNRGHDMVRGGAGSDDLDGGLGNDDLRGDGGHDLLLGKAGNDLLLGGRGQDMLRGGLGSDEMDGGRGRDVMVGGAGADRFVFTKNGGSDLVRDFRDNVDELALDASLWAGSLSAQQVVTRFAEEDGALVVFTFDGGEVLTVRGVGDAAALVDDILFV